jgi:putative transposase
MNGQQAGLPNAAMARVLGVLKPGYYAWAKREPTARALADVALLKRIRAVRLGSRNTYGAPHVAADLREQDKPHSRKRIARLMREAGLAAASHRRNGPIAARRDHEARPAPDLVDRNFMDEALNGLWVADITKILSANQLVGGVGMEVRDEPATGTDRHDPCRDGARGPGCFSQRNGGDTAAR